MREFIKFKINKNNIYKFKTRYLFIKVHAFEIHFLYYISISCQKPLFLCAQSKKSFTIIKIGNFINLTINTN